LRKRDIQQGHRACEILGKLLRPQIAVNQAQMKSARMERTIYRFPQLRPKARATRPRLRSAFSEGNPFVFG
jgi:hypothetical protein